MSSAVPDDVNQPFSRTLDYMFDNVSVARYAHRGEYYYVPKFGGGSKNPTEAAADRGGFNEELIPLKCFVGCDRSFGRRGRAEVREDEDNKKDFHRYSVNIAAVIADSAVLIFSPAEKRADRELSSENVVGGAHISHIIDPI